MKNTAERHWNQVEYERLLARDQPSDPNDHSIPLMVQKGGKMNYPTGRFESSDESTPSDTDEEMPLYDNQASGMNHAPVYSHSVAEATHAKI